LTKKRRDPRAQSLRKLEGNSIEKTVVKDMEKKFPDKKIKLQSREGVDIVARNGRIIKVEVKSARQWERSGERKRKGRFIIKPDDLNDAEFIAFVVKPVDDEFKWDKSKMQKIKYIKTSTIKKFLEDKGFDLHKQRKNIKISISEMKEMKGNVKI